MTAFDRAILYSTAGAFWAFIISRAFVMALGAHS